MGAGDGTVQLSCLYVRVTPWRREGDSVGAGSGVPPDSGAPGSPMGPIRSYRRLHTAADARRPASAGARLGSRYGTVEL